jgi:hypothetical protein
MQAAASRVPDGDDRASKKGVDHGRFGALHRFRRSVRGRERQALKVFGEAFEYYSRLQQEGEIESFEPVILEPHGGELGGFFLLRGD